MTLRRIGLDRTAVLLSAACAAHCILLPPLIVLLPVFAQQLLETTAFHAVMLGLVAPVSSVALALGVANHRRVGVAVAGAIGLTILIAAAIGAEALGETGERALTSLGSGVVALTHIANLRRARACARSAV